MAGTSSYFSKSKNTMEVAVKSVARQYRTQRRPIKIEYETSNVVSVLTAEEEKKIDCSNIKVEETEESQTNTTNKAPFTGIQSSRACVNVNIKEETEAETVKNEYLEKNKEAYKINIKEEIMGNELVKSENCNDSTWAPEWVPKNWEILLHNIKEMRKHRTAVVDILGCERLSDLWEPPEVKRFQTLTSLLLSAQTKDEVTSAAVVRLKKHGLNVENIIKTPDSEIGKLVYPVGFWKSKAKYLKKCAVICQESYNGDIPSTLKGLLSLPGIGPKMAHICMNVAWREMTGIGVDTHVHRIANRLAWVRKPTKVPEDTRKQLESWLPKNEWHDLNILFVGFGQEICKSVGPNCEGCLNNGLCPSAFKYMAKNRKKKKIKEEEDNKKIKLET